MIDTSKTYKFVGSGSVGATFDEVCSRFALIAERSTRAFRTLPELRQFQLHLAAALRQASLQPAPDAAAIRHACEAFLISTEEYLDAVEGQGKSRGVVRLKSHP